MTISLEFSGVNSIFVKSTASVPEGWTDHKWHLAAKGFPAADYNLQPGKLLLYNQELATFLVSVGDKKFYLWNEISDGVREITKPTSLDEIKKILGTRGKQVDTAEVKTS